jgi:hypothetical protein
LPYIESKSDRREKLRNGEPALTAGELNYQIFFYVKHCGVDKSVIECFIGQFFAGEKINYQKYNDMTGALIRCYVEIKRRLNIEVDDLLDICASYNDEIAKYEDLKCDQNGDVE